MLMAKIIFWTAVPFAAIFLIGLVYQTIFFFKNQKDWTDRHKEQEGGAAWVLFALFIVTMLIVAVSAQSAYGGGLN